MKTSDDEIFDQIAETIGRDGWCVFQNFLSDSLTSQLASECITSWQQGDFRRAGVGFGAQRQVRPEIRSDHVMWLDPLQLSPIQQSYFDILESLRLALNRRLFLSLFEYEGHFAIYPPGSFYRKHLDQFKAVQYRIVTCILYLNTDWRAEDGGMLRMYCDPDDETSFLDVLPKGGTLVSFLSAELYHEVLPSRRDRASITGWFKTRTT